MSKMKDNKHEYQILGLYEKIWEGSIDINGIEVHTFLKNGCSCEIPKFENIIQLKNFIKINYDYSRKK